MTKYAYNDAGLVARRKRLDGSETLTTLVMSYDAAGRGMYFFEWGNKGNPWVLTAEKVRVNKKEE